MANIHPFQRFHLGQKAILIFNGTALVMKSSNPKNTSWEIPGGRISEGENLKEAFVREIYEEAGIDLEKTEYTRVFIDLLEAYDYLVDDAALLLIVYKIELKSKPEVKLSDEHTEFRWIANENIDEIQFRSERTKELYIKALAQ